MSIFRTLRTDAELARADRTSRWLLICVLVLLLAVLQWGPGLLTPDRHPGRHFGRRVAEVRHKVWDAQTAEDVKRILGEPNEIGIGGAVPDPKFEMVAWTYCCDDEDLTITFEPARKGQDMKGRQVFNVHPMPKPLW